MPEETVWPRAPHTRAKHDLLVGYLGAWFAILGSSQRRVIVLDGFAGPGVYSGGEPGSPTLTVQTLLNHGHFPRWNNCEFIFIFNEQHPARFASLESVLESVQKPGNVKVISRNQKFSELADSILESLNGNQMAPTFAFVDPFGYGDIPLNLIKQLLSYRACELFIYFDFNSINRFATAGVVDHRLDELFGTDEYKNAPPSGDPRRGAFLHDLYERQLRSVCDFAHVQSFAMRNDQGRIGNYLFFCTRDLQAFDRMKSVMWKLAPSGDYSFDDRFAGQSVLFDESADTAPLQAALLENFAGRTVESSELVRWVIAETPYHAGQVKRNTLAPMQEAGLISSPNQKRRKQFPDGTMIAFPA